jgi:hypothetical protein
VAPTLTILTASRVSMYAFGDGAESVGRQLDQLILTLAGEPRFIGPRAETVLGVIAVFQQLSMRCSVPRGSLSAASRLPQNSAMTWLGDSEPVAERLQH